jgi:hypothetical protein
VRQVLNHFVYLDCRATHCNILGVHATPRPIASIMMLLRNFSRLTTATILIAVDAELLYNGTILENATFLAPRCIEAVTASIA